MQKSAYRISRKKTYGEFLGQFWPMLPKFRMEILLKTQAQALIFLSVPWNLFWKNPSEERSFYLNRCLKIYYTSSFQCFPLFLSFLAFLSIFWGILGKIDIKGTVTQKRSKSCIFLYVLTKIAATSRATFVMFD